MPNDLSLNFILFFTTGGLVMSVLAGTSLAGEPRRWWSVAFLVAVAATIVNAWPQFRPDIFLERSTPPEVSTYVGLFVYYALITLVIAGVGRIGFRREWPWCIRSVLCLITDFALRSVLPIALIIIACTIDSQGCDL